MLCLEQDLRAQQVGIIRRGNVAVCVTNDPGYLYDGRSVTRSGFAYYAKITAISPAEVRTTGDTDITITGVGFPLAPDVSIEGIPPQNVVRGSSTTIRCRTRQHAAGRVSVYVLNAGDPTGFPFPLSYCEPLITSLSPTKGALAGGTDVTIYGKYFHDSNVNVHFDGQAATAVNVVSPTELVATTPAHVGGAVNVRVTSR